MLSGRSPGPAGRQKPPHSSPSSEGIVSAALGWGRLPSSIFRLLISVPPKRANRLEQGLRSEAKLMRSQLDQRGALPCKGHRKDDSTCDVN